MVFRVSDFFSMKKKFAIGAGLVGSIPALAQEGSGSLGTAVSALQTAAVGTIDAVVPAVQTVLVALFTLVGLVVAFRWISRVVRSR